MKKIFGLTIILAFVIVTFMYFSSSAYIFSTRKEPAFQSNIYQACVSLDIEPKLVKHLEENDWKVGYWARSFGSHVTYGSMVVRNEKDKEKIINFLSSKE